MEAELIKLTTSTGSDFNLSLSQPTGGMAAGVCLLIHNFNHGSPTEKVLLQAIWQGRYKVYSLNLSAVDLAVPGMLEACSAYLDLNEHLPILCIGHSLGAALLLQYLPIWPTPKAIACIGCPSKYSDFRDFVDEDNLEEEAALVKIGPVLTVDIDPALLDNLHDELLLDKISTIRKPVLLLHSPQDKFIDIAAAGRLYSVLHHPKSFISLDGSDHLLNDEQNARYAGNSIISWADRYLELPESEPLRTRMEVVTNTPAGTFTTQVRAGNHTFYADEPIKLGGKDLGPTPYDLLCAALGACTSMTLQMYAARKKWPLEQAIVHLKHDRVYAKDCDSCENNRNKLDRLSREIELIGPLTAEQQNRLLEIADKCPVHRTLEGEIKVVTKLETKPHPI